MGDKDTESRFDVFISYNTADRVAVEVIAQALVERGLAVFIDRWELVAGQPWPEVLERRISDCGSAAVVLGPSGIGTWQHREQFLALDRQARDGSFSVIPVLLPGADPALGFLALNTWIDLRNGIDDTSALDLLAGAVRGETAASLAEASQRATTDVCPYRGLEVFREEDAPFFFGREAFTMRLLETIQAQDFVAVVGASGSGKSSVVRAGLVPMLRRGSDGTVWDVLTLTPGAEPLAALARTLDPPSVNGLIAARRRINAAAASLRAGDVTVKQLIADHLEQQHGTDRLLLVVDQFEELATLTEDRADAGRFIDLLLETSARGGAVTVLITLRSDFYTQIVQRRDLNDRLQGAVVHIGPMSQAQVEGEPSELEIVVRRPAEAVGLGFEDGLVERIVADVGDEPGNLPLLEYLLSELWRQRVRGVLTHRAYDTLGGVQGAIAGRADTTYSQLAPEEQQAARRLFLSLIRPGDGQEDTRAPAPFPEDEHETAVARRFSGPGVRLLVADEDALRGRFIQVSHEALIRGWSRLRNWIARNRDTLRARDRVRERMEHWREQNRPADLLLPPGLALEEGRSLLTSDTDVAIGDLRDYVGASLAADVSRRRRRRALAGAIALVGVLFLSVTVWQWRAAEVARDRAEENSRLADKNARQAEQERDLALAQQLNTTARKVFDENPGDTGLAAMLAVESQLRRNTPEANALLRDVLALTPLETPLVDFPWVNAGIQVSADGRTLVLENRDSSYSTGEPAAASSVILLERTDFNTLSTRRFGGTMRPLLSPDGRWLVSAGLGRRLVVTDVDAGTSVVDEPTRSRTFPVFDPDGSRLYVAKPTGVIEVRKNPEWAVTRQLAFPVTGARNVSLRIGISADGEQLFVVDRRRGAYLVPTDGSAVKSLEIEFDPQKPWFASEHLSSGRVSPVQPLAMTRQANGMTRIWDMKTGRERLNFEDEARGAAAVFGPDGETIATANSNGMVFVRNASDGAIRHRWQHREDWNRDDDWINVLAFSADGRLLASAGEDGVIVIRNAVDGTPWHRFELGAPVVVLIVDPLDGTLLAGTEDGTLARLDPGTRTVVAKRRFDGIVTHIETSGSKDPVAIGIQETRDRSTWYDISFVERASGREISHASFNGSLRSRKISPDGRWFAAFDLVRYRVLVWDTRTGEIVREIPGRAQPEAFSRDSTRLLLHDGTGPVLVVDIATGKQLFALGEPGGINEVFGEAYVDTAITLGVDRSLRGWDLSTGKSSWHTVPEQQDTWVTASPDGSKFAYYADSDQAIRVFDSKTGRHVGSVETGKPTRGFSISDDGSRILTVHAPKVSDPAHEIALWGVPAATRIQHRHIDSQQVIQKLIGGAHVALRGVSSGEERATSWLELIDWESGRVAWSLSVQHAAPFLIKYVNHDLDRILVEGPTSPQDLPSRQLRSLSAGELIWQEPGSSLRAAADVPGTDLIAFADATSLDRTGDVIRLLSRLTGEEQHRIGAGGFARHVAGTADGTHVVAAVEGDRWRGVRVWRVDDGRLVREIELDANPRAILPLSNPDHVAVDDFADKLRVFDLRSGEQLQQIAHARSADTVIAAKIADRAVTVAGASLRVWDTRNGQEIARHTSHGDASSVTISPDGTQVAYLTNRPYKADTGAEYPAAVIWTPQSKSEPVILPVDDANRVEFDPSGRHLALHGKNGAYIRLVDASTLRTEQVLTPLRNGKLDQLAFAAESRIVLTRETGEYKHRNQTQRRRSLRAFDIESGEELSRFDMGTRLLPVPSAAEVLYQDVHQRWRSTDLSSRDLDPILAIAKSTPDRVPTNLAVAPGSPRLLATSYWKQTLVHDLTNEQTKILTSGDEPFNVLHAAMDLGGQYVALSMRERDWRDDSPGSIVVYDAADGIELARLEIPRAMWNVAFVNGGDALVLSELRGHLPKGQDHLLFYWNWRTGERKTLARDNPVSYIATTLDGHRFATAEGSWDTDRNKAVGVLQLRIWDGANGSELVRVPLDRDPSAVEFSPDGRHLVIGTQNRVLLLESGSGTELTRFRGADSQSIGTEHDYAIETNARSTSGFRALGFAVGGQELVIVEANSVLLFNISQRSTRRLPGSEPIKLFAISADGKLLATSGERFVSIWDVAAGRALVRTESLGIKNLVFGGMDGQQLLATRDDKLIQLRWDPGELRSLACRAFKNADWQRGHRRIIQQSTPHPCDSETPGE